MIRNAIARLMYGRYGGDQLNLCLLGLDLVFFFLFVATHFSIFYLLSYVMLFLAVFRMFSRNLSRRREENFKFLHAVDPLVRWYRLRRNIHRDKDHRYFKCPNCGQQLRVPKGKGVITVTCRGCGASFREKS